MERCPENITGDLRLIFNGVDVINLGTFVIEVNDFFAICSLGQSLDLIGFACSRATVIDFLDGDIICGHSGQRH